MYCIVFPNRIAILSILQNREVRANISSVIIIIINIEEHSTTSHVLGLLSRGNQFESYKPQSQLKFT
jgi:hypothetical protein